MDQILDFKYFMGEKDKEKARENLTSEEKEEISKILIAAEKELP